MSSEIATKKQRRQNVTSEDLNILADAVASNKAHLVGKFTSTITANSKSSIWEKISNQINAKKDTVRRTGEEVKRKWTDWSSTIKKSEKEGDTSDDRRGPAVPESTDLELKVLAVIGKDATDEFDGWLDTAVTAVSVASPSPSTSASSPSTPANVETESGVIPNNLTVNIEHTRA